MKLDKKIFQDMFFQVQASVSPKNERKVVNIAFEKPYSIFALDICLMVNPALG